MVRRFLLLNRFSAKIILILLLVILIPTLLTSVSFYMASNSILKQNVRASTVQIAKQTADSLSSIFDVGNDISNLIYSDKSIQQTVMHLDNTSTEEKSRLYQDVKTSLNNLVYSNSHVKNVYVLKEEGKGWGSGDFSDYKLKRTRLSDLNWVKEAKRADGEMVWRGIQYDRFSGGSKNTDLVLPIDRVMKNFSTMSNIGFVQVNLNGRAILGTIEQLKLGKTGTFFVVDAEGNRTIDSDLGLIGKKVENPQLYDYIVRDDASEFEFDLNGVPYYGVKQPLSNGWMIVGTVPIHEITGQLDWLRSRILFSSGIFGLLAVVLGLLISRSVINPVKQLTLNMRHVQEGNLKVRTSVQSSDEIGFLSKQFNNMLNEIEHLMKQIENEQSQKHLAELRAVIHRVHPHFLYNTLGTFRWLIKSKRYDHAYKGLTALTRLLEANMAKSGNIITVEEELNIIRKYLTILELRYEKDFKLELDVEPGAEKVMIPRMLLQPLVENAVFHGIVPKKTGGCIRIRILFHDGDLEFVVEDDGRGMSSDKLNTLNDPEKAIAKEEMGIGLRHIYDTLRLHYAGRSEWSVTSRPNQGTTVRILLKNIHL